MKISEDHIYSLYQHNPPDLETYQRMYNRIDDHFRKISFIGERLYNRQLGQSVHSPIEHYRSSRETCI